MDFIKLIIYENLFWIKDKLIKIIQRFDFVKHGFTDLSALSSTQMGVNEC
jgi:hypothetical protein